MSEHLRYTKDGTTAWLRFNRPEKKNALTTAMYDGLVRGLEDAASDDEIRSIAIVGGADFTAGNDIGDFLSAGALSEELPVIRFLRVLRDFPKPVLAGVKGAAIGIGTTILLHCDAIVLGRSAHLALPFTKLGLVPEAASSVLLPLAIGRMRASWLLLSGEAFGAEDAREMGLATRVADDADVDETVATMCASFAQLPPRAVMTTKRLLRERFADVVEHAMRDEFQAFETALHGEEARAAFARFLQRG